MIKLLESDNIVFKPLKEIGSFIGGLSGKSKDDFINGNSKYITYMNVFSNFQVSLDINDYVNIDKSERQNSIEYGDILFTGSSETREECGYSSVVCEKINEKIYLNSFCFIYRLNDKNIFLPEFSKYLFRSEFMRKQIRKTASGVTRFNISKSKMEDVVVPIIPIYLQQEIVEKLDKFKLVCEKLNEEHILREKQYNYYLDKILDFSKRDNVEYYPLSDVANYRRGSFPQPYTDPKFYGGEGAMPFVQVADMRDDGFKLNSTTRQTISKLAQPKSVFVKKGTIIVSLQGTLGRVVMTQYDSYVDRTMAIFEDYKIDINKKYFAYVLKQKFAYEKMHARGTTLKTITKEEFSKFEIPVPSLEIQNEIVEKLDKLDDYTYNLECGLPAEIRLRNLQFDYYLNTILNF